MTKMLKKIKFPNDLNNIDVSHCCLQRGVKLKLSFTKPAREKDIRALQNFKIIENLFILSQNSTGFYRFILHDKVTVAGTLNSLHTEIQYSFYERTKTSNILTDFFPGFDTYWQCLKDEKI